MRVNLLRDVGFVCRRCHRFLPSAAYAPSMLNRLANEVWGACRECWRDVYKEHAARPAHGHGTQHCYEWHRCRCEFCRAAARRYMRRYRGKVQTLEQKRRVLRKQSERDKETRRLAALARKAGLG